MKNLATSTKRNLNIAIHEKRLLKKVDFINLESLDGNLHEVKVMRRFHVQKRDEYTA